MDRKPNPHPQYRDELFEVPALWKLPSINSKSAIEAYIRERRKWGLPFNDYGRIKKDRRPSEPFIKWEIVDDATMPLDNIFLYRCKRLIRDHVSGRFAIYHYVDIDLISSTTDTRSGHLYVILARNEKAGLAYGKKDRFFEVISEDRLFSLDDAMDALQEIIAEHP